MRFSLPSFKVNERVVGLDIGSSSVKAVELTKTPMGHELTRMGVAPLPSEAIVQGAFLNTSAIVEAIQEAIEKAGIQTKDVATAVSGHSVIVKKISVPESTREALEESIRWEAEQYIPFDVNEVNLDFQILENEEAASQGQMDVLLVAAKKDLLDDYVQVIAEAGYTPAIVDVAGFAMENAYEANHEVAADEVIALINIGSQVVNINIAAGGVPVFTRDVALGGSQYTEEIQKTLSIGFEEAEQIKIGESPSMDSQEVVPQEVEQAMRSVTQTIVGEIARSLEFYTATSTDSRIDRVILAGGSSKVSGLARAFEERLDVPVEHLDPLQRISAHPNLDTPELQDMSASLAVGVGLALRRLDEE